MLKKGRDTRAPLEIESSERRIHFGADGKIAAIVPRASLPAHKLIEEFMIQANVSAAETLEQRRTPLIYRVHDTPSDEKIQALVDFLDTLGIKWSKGQRPTTERFDKLLEQTRGGPHADIVNEVVLRTQMQAIYDTDNIGHFGLNLDRYAHFTSPIRRYADLVVHRALIRAGKLGADGQPDGVDARALAEIAATISATERRAMKAERETADRLIAHFLADRVGATFDGHISGVTRAGLFVELDETGADGFVPARTIGDEYFRFDEAGRAFVGRAVTHRLGDPVTVELVEAAPVAGALRFKLVGHDRAAEKRTGHKPRSRPKFAPRQNARGRRRR